MRGKEAGLELVGPTPQHLLLCKYVLLSEREVGSHWLMRKQKVLGIKGASTFQLEV